MITERKRTEAERAEMNRQLVTASRLAGMAEVATSVLHNVGNVLNSVNVSATLASERIRRSSSSDVARVASILQEHSGDLPRFFSGAQGVKLPGYLTNLARHLAEEQSEILAELGSLNAHIDHIKQIVAAQQRNARMAGISEAFSPASLVEEALRIQAAARERHGVEVIRDYAETPLLEGDKHKALQILVNLISNAKNALDGARATGHRLTLRIRQASPEGVTIAVSDEGEGIPAENLTRIFAHGFTTRHEGHGFGLHSAALAAKEMGGSLSVKSDGSGLGAVFTLKLPHRCATTDVV